MEYESPGSVFGHNFDEVCSSCLDSLTRYLLFILGGFGKHFDENLMRHFSLRSGCDVLLFISKWKCRHEQRTPYIRDDSTLASSAPQQDIQSLVQIYTGQKA